MHNKRVLILDACQRSALAVTRSLGSKGITVITADETASALAGCSRYSREYCTCSSPRDNSDAFIADVINICHRHEIGIVMPMTELTATLLLDQHKKLSGVVLPFADSKIVNTIADKCRLMKLARSLDIPVPLTRHMQPNDIFDTEQVQSFPLVMKPGKSWLKVNDEWIHTSVRIASTSREASEIHTDDPAFHTESYLLQEYIPGTGAGVFAIYNQGEPIAFFAHQRLREKPPRGGMSVLSESTAVDPVLQTYTRKLLDTVKWHGVAMVEFRISDDGSPYLMEINTRFWGSLQLAVDAGIDFPWLLYQVASSEKVESVVNYRTGIRLRWLLGDLDSLYLVLRDAEFSLKEKLKAFVAFLTPSPFKTRHEVNRWGDVGPFWWELKQYMKDLLK